MTISAESSERGSPWYVLLIYGEITLADSRFDGLSINGEARVSLENSEIVGLGAGGSSQVEVNSSVIFGGLRAADSSQVTLVNSQISNSKRDGIVVRGSAQISLQGTLVSNNGRDGLSLGGVAGDVGRVEIENSRILNNKRCGIGLYSPRGQIRGGANEIQGNGADLCGFVPASLRKPLVPPTDKLQLTVPSDYATLQEAIDAIAPGGTIKVQTGGYKAGLTIWKPLTLRGVGRTHTVLRLRALPERELAISIIAEAQGVVLEGLTITGSSRLGVDVYGNVLIRDALIYGNGGAGINLHVSAEATIIDSAIPENVTGINAGSTVTLVNTQISNNKRVGVKAEGFTPTTLHLQNVKVFGSEIGLSIASGSHLFLINSQIIDNRSDGLVLAGSSAQVHSSVFEGNGTSQTCQKPASLGRESVCTGIELRGRAQLTLRDSVIRNHPDWGLAAMLERCGYVWDKFTGRQVIFEGTNVIEGNNRSGNQDGMGNPGDHPFKDLPDGQVCLP